MRSIFDNRVPHDPPQCGGTTSSRDRSAPAVIRSRDMTLFDVTSVLPFPAERYGKEGNVVGYVSAYAVPAEGGTFLLLEERGRRREPNRCAYTWRLIRENLFPTLADLVIECDLARENGRHSETHGLPENFGGDIDIRYSSGEYISVSNNQSPVLSYESGLRIANLFESTLKKEEQPLPDLSGLEAVRFYEKRDSGGFSKAALSIRPDGTGVLTRSDRYDTTVYDSNRNMDANEVEIIKSKVTQYGVLAWESLPERDYRFGGEKTLTFRFSDGRERVISGNCMLPRQLWNGFFEIERSLNAR